jgi:U6 snRNA-associated Sm-like protein LSm1
MSQEYLPGAASIGEHLDNRLLVTLRDGRHLIGTLRSFDQFMNLVLESTVERIIYGGELFKLLSSHLL